jgi:hypothetical protein
MTKHEVTVTLTAEDIKLYDRARAIGLPSIVVSMYGNRIKMLLAEEREACAKVCDDWPNGRDDVYSIGVAIRARGQA